MKKLTLFLMGFLFSGMALAIPLNGTSDLKVTDCNLLLDDVKIVLTNNVEGGINCDTTPGASFIAISLCHTSGREASRSSVVTLNPDLSVKCVVVDGVEDCVETVIGASFPTASTRAGTVTSIFPGTNTTCTAANAEAQAGVVVAPPETP